MKATTVKIEEPLLNELNDIKPAGVSFSRYVRQLLKSDIDRMKLKEAAAKYNALIADNKAERAAMEEWEKADLATAPEGES